MGNFAAKGLDSCKQTGGNGRELCRKNSKISAIFRESLANGSAYSRSWPIICDSAAGGLPGNLWLFFRRSSPARLNWNLSKLIPNSASRWPGTGMARNLLTSRWPETWPQKFENLCALSRIAREWVRSGPIVADHFRSRRWRTAGKSLAFLPAIFPCEAGLESLNPNSASRWPGRTSRRAALRSAVRSTVRSAAREKADL